jgi:ribonuclease HII
MPLQLPSSNVLEVGIDEVGRGCLFGDVVAAAVILPNTFPDDTWLQIKDSKKLSKKKRDELSAYIKEHAIGYAIGCATPEEIDRMNILQATMCAMHRACDSLWEKHPFENGKLMVDGNYFKRYSRAPHELVKGGDNKVLSIAAASILAKTYRDHQIAHILREHPEFGVYGLATNMGYGTKAHMAAIASHGLTAYHRRSFRCGDEKMKGGEEASDHE